MVSAPRFLSPAQTVRWIWVLSMFPAGLSVEGARETRWEEELGSWRRRARAELSRRMRAQQLGLQPRRRSAGAGRLRGAQSLQCPAPAGQGGPQHPVPRGFVWRQPLLAPCGFIALGVSWVKSEIGPRTWGARTDRRRSGALHIGRR